MPAACSCPSVTRRTATKDGAGRYLLDAAKSADLGGDADRGTLILDFNFAYQPSCAFDPKWACPLAPPDNWLDIPIRPASASPEGAPSGDLRTVPIGPAVRACRGSATPLAPPGDTVGHNGGAGCVTIGRTARDKLESRAFFFRGGSQDGSSGRVTSGSSTASRMRSRAAASSSSRPVPSSSARHRAD